MHPLSFTEFLRAGGEELAAESIPNVSSLDPWPLHDKLTGLLKEYFFCGGMPEAVAAFIDGADSTELRRIQGNIIKGYELDFAKHAGAHESIRIQQVWDAVPGILARENRKFLYGAVRSGARARDYETALQWLFEAGVLMKSRRVQTPKLPLSAYADPRAFKVFVGDVGLLGALLRVSADVLTKGNRLFDEFNGAFTENYVAQQLRTRGYELFYWTSSGNAEVDFVLEHRGDVLPLEVKAGVNARSKSLRVYRELYAPVATSRATLLNATSNGGIDNYPLYMVEAFPVAPQVFLG